MSSIIVPPDFQRANKRCHKDGCDSQAKWSVAVAFNTVNTGNGTKRYECGCSIQVCDAHREDVTGYVLSDKNRNELVATMKNEALDPPNFDTFEIHLFPLGRKKSKLLMQ